MPKQVSFFNWSNSILQNIFFSDAVQEQNDGGGMISKLSPEIGIEADGNSTENSRNMESEEPANTMETEDICDTINSESVRTLPETDESEKSVERNDSTDHRGGDLCRLCHHAVVQWDRIDSQSDGQEAGKLKSF